MKRLLAAWTIINLEGKSKPIASIQICQNHGETQIATIQIHITLNIFVSYIC